MLLSVLILTETQLLGYYAFFIIGEGRMTIFKKNILTPRSREQTNKSLNKNPYFKFLIYSMSLKKVIE